MLRLCRSTLSFGTVDPQQAAGGPVIHFGDTAPESSPAALPLGACFEYVQQLGDLDRLQLRLLLGKLAPQLWCACAAAWAAPSSVELVCLYLDVAGAADALLVP